jgi:signal transduction histidine kinase/HPt (histidine-containing phosphotransfer) domain-containing protein
MVACQMNPERTTRMHESTKSRTAAVAKRLTILYMAALGTIALLAIMGQLVVQQAIIRLEGDSRIINIAGKQRMLSQRLTRLTYELAYCKQQSQASNSTQSDLAAQIRTDLKTWNENHDGLQHGSEDLRLPGQNSDSVETLFNALTPHFKSLQEIIDIALVQFDSDGKGSFDEAVRKELGYHSDAFLSGMDSIVTRLEEEARDRVTRLRWIETVLLIATIGVLGCEGLYVFSPAVASLNRTLSELQSTSDELEESKDAAENANRAKTEFLARVSHELRTPLHAILGMLGLVEQGKLRSNQRDKIRLANEASTSLLSLVDDLLDVAGIEQRREIVLHPSVVDLHGLISSTAEMMRPMAIQKGLRFELNLDKALPNSAFVDSDKVRQVLTNLLQNAIRYTKNGDVRCSVNIVTVGSKFCLQMEVEDTGIGISPNDQVRIFASLSSGNHLETSNAFGQGLGLGLAITQAMVKKLDGTLSLKSEVGKGSRFTVSLPIAICDAINPQTAPVVKSAHPSPNRFGSFVNARRTALIVDDSPTNLLVMRSYMKELGYRTMSVSSLTDSLARIRKHRFDIVLMDRHLPDGDGLDLASMFAGPNGHVSAKFFLVTAEIHLPPSSKERLKAFSGVLHKPVSISQLRLALESIVLCDITELDRLKQKLSRIFMDGFPRECDTIKAMFATGDYSGIEFVAHRMIGSAGNAGLSDIVSLARGLQEAATTQDKQKIERSLSQLVNFST